LPYSSVTAEAVARHS